MRTRIAPTPSGFLHLGNCVNFRLITDAADAGSGIVRLRIDDMDAVRARPEYVDDIFRVLAWLDIAPDEGPSDRTDFEANFALSRRTEYYRDQLEVLRANGGNLFVCACSRADLVNGMCVRGCIDAALELRTDENALRMRLPADAVVEISGESIDLRRAHGDVVLWRRDGLPAYHLVTVIEDRDARITHVIRGEDLRESSALHAQLAPLLDAPVPHYLHHPLVRDSRGEKLSKSVLAGSRGPLELTPELLRVVRARAGELSAALR